MNLISGPIAFILITALVSVPAVLGQANGAREQRLDREFQAAAALYEAGRLPEAAGSLEKLVREVPRSFEVHELLGLVYAAQRMPSQATEHLELAVRLKPDSTEARTNYAANLVQSGKLALAEQQFKKAVELAPQSYDTNHNMGEFYVQAGKLPSAIGYLEQAQKVKPAAYNNGYDLALAYLQTGQAAGARQTASKLLKQKDTAELHNLLGQIEEKDGKFVEAANQFEAAARMDPSESNLFDWASELLLHRTLDPAIEVFRQAAGRYPASERTAVGLGMALYSRGNYDDAVKSLLKAADLNPNDPACYYFLSKAYDSSPAQADDVIQRFRRFAELQPQNGRASYYYAMSLWKGKRAQDAAFDVGQIEGLLKKAIAADPKLAEAYLQLGNLYSDQNKYADAVPEYEKALDLNSDLADAHYRLGQAYVHTGQKDRAQEQFQVYQRLRAEHLAELDKQRAEIRQFVYAAKESQNSKQ